MSTNPALIEARFWALVDKRGSCWLWTGTRGHGGYGHFGVGRLGVDRRVVTAHRFAWELTNGAIPDGLYVLHTCDNRWCVNPEHLWLGTAADNAHDAVAKGRLRSASAAKTHCPSGHPYTGDNVIFDRRGWRKCRECRRARLREKQRRRALAAGAAGWGA